jgi:outer membrane lipoprotein-sorting protein
MNPLLLIYFLFLPQQFNWVSFTMVKRINKTGVTSWMDARIHFDKSGDMVTYFTKPEELYILNNADGELKIYNPKENSVFKSVNYNYSSQHTPIFYFLNQKEDMGLAEAGYNIEHSEVNDMMLVTKWIPPENTEIDLSYIEVVNDGEKNVFQGFYDIEGICFKKVYYYNFHELAEIDIPKSITEIDFIEDDSVITKTTYSDFILNDPVDKEILNLKIPENAKLLGQ